MVDKKQEPRWKQYLKGQRNEQTSAQVGSLAANQLRDPKSTPAQKSVAGSALTQRPTLRRLKVKYPKP